MSIAKERSLMAHDSFMMNSHIINPLSTQSPYSSPEEFIDQGHKRSNSDQDGQSVISFSGFLMSTCSHGDDPSLLSFDPLKEDQSYDNSRNSNPRFDSDYGCFQTDSDYGSSITECAVVNKGSKDGSDGSYGWLYSDLTVTTDHSFDESVAQDSAGYNKRPNMRESTQVVKKHCTSTHSANNNSKKPKVQKPSVAKDPQSIAAKNRRERISERLKVLQELVPNGTKVDLVTMLEKAIGYVKFLQLQVKVLATDDFWPVQGGKAPDISQVREAIDAILSSSSQRDRNSSSK